MNCPRCNTMLTISNTQGVEIDYCPNCRGVWLDRGELEKIIERSNSYGAPYPGGQDSYRQHDDHHDDKYFGRSDDHGYQGDGHYGKRKKGFLGDLFDF